MKMMRKLGTALSAVSIVAASCITTAPAVADDENQQAASPSGCGVRGGR